jgi:phosphatidylserine decarboxylase
MKNYPHPIIAKEGWNFLIVSLCLAIFATMLGGWWSVPLWIIYFFILQFFRDPPREIPAGENLVLCPADGRVIVVGVVRDPYRGVDALKISVFMNVFNVHSNRSPVDATVKEVVYNKGFFVNASFDKASSDNERNALILRMDNGTELSCVQVAGLIARRILCYVRPGERLTRGQRYGFIRFGSRVDVYLPTTARPRVAIGDKVKATTTVIAELSP